MEKALILLLLKENKKRKMKIMNKRKDIEKQSLKMTGQVSLMKSQAGAGVKGEEKQLNI